MKRVQKSWYHATTNVLIGAVTMERSSWKVYLNVPCKIELIFSVVFVLFVNLLYFCTCFVLKVSQYIFVASHSAWDLSFIFMCVG